MGKNKKNKKKTGNCKKKDPKEEQLDLTLVDEEGDEAPVLEEDCDCSIRSDDAVLPTSDNGSAAVYAGKDEKISLEGLQLNEDDERLRSLMRDRDSWAAMEESWTRKCSDFNELTQNANQWGDTGSNVFMAGFEAMQNEVEAERRERREAMAENARAHGVKPLSFMESASLPRREAFVPPIKPKFSPKGMQEFIAKWKAVQDTYPIGNPQVGRCDPLKLSQRHPQHSEAKNSPSRPQKTVFQPRELNTEDEEEDPGPVPPPSNMPPSQPVPRPPKNMDDKIRVRVLCADQDDMIVSLKRTLTMLKLKERHSQKLGRNPKSLVYRYKGKNLRDSDTVVSLGMIENDVIHVMKAPPLRRH